jgi:branched-chain amino acid transport system substrate-binding protein
VSPAAAAPAQAQSVSVVRLYGFQNTTGPSADLGIQAQNGSELAAKQTNAAGGFVDDQGHRYTVEVVPNNVTNATEGIALLRSAAADGTVAAVVGPTNSAFFIPAAPVAAQLSIPLIGTGTGAPLDSWNVWTYRVNPVLDTGTPVLLQKVTQKLGLKKMALIVDQAQASQVADAVVVRQQADKLGYQVVADTTITGGAADFSSQVSTVKASNPDAVYVAVQPADIARLLVQFDAANLNTSYLTGFGAFYSTSMWDSSNGLSNGGYTWIAQDLQNATGPLKDMIDQYTLEYPQAAFTVNSLYGYDGVHVALAAVKKANTNTNRTNIQQTLASLETTTPIGTQIKFQNPPTGDNQTPVVNVIQITGRESYQILS